MIYSHELFQGVFTALVTPFFAGKIDFDSLDKLIEHQIASGVQGIVLLGTTGESSTLEEKEREQLLRHALDHIDHRISVLIGTGCNCTKKTLKLSEEAFNLGADGVVIVAPYYNRPTQEGLYLHYKTIAQAIDKPICLYSNPSRCGVEIALDTIVHLRQEFKNISAIKEAGGSCNRVSQLIKDNDIQFKVLGGDDALALPFYALGAKGLVSVASNWIAKPLVDMFRLVADNDLESAASINRKFYPLFRALSIETNPVPIKQVLYEKGLIKSPEVRLPLCPLSDKNLTTVRQVIESLHGVS